MKQFFSSVMSALGRWLVPERPSFYDRSLLALMFSLMGIGLMMVASASIKEGPGGDMFYFTKRHLIFLFICLGFGIGTLFVSLERWRDWSSRLLIGALSLLFAVLAIGRTVNGAKRWIGFGFFNIQPAELAKLALIIFIASYLVRRSDEVRMNFFGFIKPLAVVFVMAFMLLLQPDLGSVIVLFVCTFGLLFIGGAKVYQFIGLILVGFAALVGLILFEPYRMRRVTSFLDPWADPFGSGYQLTQSLMAFGRGGLFGQGLGNSVQKLSYLPEAHTDFVFAILGEELGYSGVLAVLFLQLLLAMKALQIGRTALLRSRLYEGYLACGIGIWFSFQTVVNVGAAAGMLPTKGLTLPLVSYGGSSLIAITMAVAILLRIDFERRLATSQVIQRELI
jgi:cell division protein FtsW